MTADLTNRCAFVIYMDRMSRMPERFKSLKEAADNWQTISKNVFDYYLELANGYLALNPSEYTAESK